VSAHVDPRLLEDAPGAARREMLRHLAGCRACRSAVAAHDPSLLFGLLADAPIPSAILDAVSRETARRIAEPVRVSRLPALAAASAALAILCGSVVFRPESAPAPVPAPALAALPRANVEVQSGAPVSQVVDFTVGDTQVVMVYNPELQL